MGAGASTSGKAMATHSRVTLDVRATRAVISLTAQQLDSFDRWAELAPREVIEACADWQGHFCRLPLTKAEQEDAAKRTQLHAFTPRRDHSAAALVQAAC